MIAVIKTGGKQYVVKPGSLLKIERLSDEIGKSIEFQDILKNESNLKVNATIVDHIRGPKIIIFKKKRRKNYRRKTGHRQDLSVIKINSIQ